MSKVYPICVIGGGSAGTMAALRAVLNNDDCLFFPGSPKDKKRSRAMWVRKVENIPGHFHYKRGIEDPNLESLNWIHQSSHNHKLHLQKNVGVTQLKKQGDLFEITDSKNQIYHARFVILCTGAMDVQPEINSSIAPIFDYANAQTIDYCLICDGHHVLNKSASVIGHTNAAAWAAIMLHERYRPSEMTILTNGNPPDFQDDTRKLILAYDIKVAQSPIIEIIGEDKGKILNGFKLKDGSNISSNITFVALGMIVYNELAKQLGADLDERGFVKGDETGLTSVPGLYVAGDLKAGTKKQIYVAWDTAVNAANAANQQLRILKRPK